MTGLDEQKHKIVEIAVIATDKKLNILSEGPCLVIHQNEIEILGMSEWCKNQFAKSGLTKQIRESKISMEEAENHVLNFIKKWVPPKTAPLCGNSIHADKVCNTLNTFFFILFFAFVFFFELENMRNNILKIKIKNAMQNVKCLVCFLFSVL